MKSYLMPACALLFNLAAAIHVHGMAGDLKAPSLAFTEATPETLRTQLIVALKDPECRFLEGHFINANTTLHYGGNGASLNRLLTRLAKCDGIQVAITFIREPDGPSWTLNHNAWVDSNYIAIQINRAAASLNMDELAITIVGKAESKPAEAGKEK